MSEAHTITAPDSYSLRCSCGWLQRFPGFRQHNIQQRAAFIMQAIDQHTRDSSNGKETNGWRWDQGNMTTSVPSPASGQGSQRGAARS